jgi:acyl dehydratase
MIQYSKLESERFGYNIYKYSNLDEVDVKLLKKSILEKEADIVFLRLNSSLKRSNSKINSMGFPIIHADTLVYYKCALNADIKPLKNDLEFEEFSENNIQLLDELVQQIFVDYTNHYWSNVFLNQEKAIQGYVEWAKNYFLGIGADKTRKMGWIVRKNNTPIGFATVNIDGSIGEGILYGVLSSFSGGGVYTDIIRFTQNYLKSLDCLEMQVSTQVQNYAVQKVWSREGFFLFQSWDTYHINAMLNYNSLNNPIENFKVTEADLEKFIEATGDNNRIHTDSSFAREKGLKEIIAHGVFVDAIQSKRFGTQNPGHGTLYAGISNVFIEPVYLNEEYQIQYRKIQEKNNLQQIVTTVKNKENKIVLVTYNVLIKR